MKNLTIIFTITIPLICLAQPFQREVDTIPVENYGWLLPAPFTGGYNNLNPYLVDIDADGDADLFCGNSSGKISYFRNDGTYNNANFILVTEYFDSIYFNPYYGHQVTICFCDIDDDNDKDMFVSANLPAIEGKILFYRNIGTPQYFDFILEDSTFAGINSNCYINVEFCDIDDDGDFDLFWSSFLNENPGMIRFYENIGTPQTYQFQYITECLDSINIYTICHPRFIDIDNDDDFDLFIGAGMAGGVAPDTSNGQIFYYENVGTPEVYDFELISTFYDSIYVQDEASPCFADIDNDGDYDLFVGKGDATAYFATGNMGGDFVFYQNNGTSNAPDFDFVTKNYLGIDVGASVCPRFCDIDADGDLDMFLAHVCNHIVFYRNIGDAQNPYFVLESEQYQGIEEAFALSIDFADIDGDDDYDLFIASGIGGDNLVALYINQGTPFEADFEWETGNLVGEIEGARPRLVDINNDNDYDLFVGWEDMSIGSIRYYENQGDPYNYDFVLVDPSYFGITTQYIAPIIDFTDIDNDGDLDLYLTWFNIYWVGVGGMIKEYLNVGTPERAYFILSDSTFEDIKLTMFSDHIKFSDIDGDGDKDLFIGCSAGGVQFYRNQSNPSPPVLSVTLSYPDVILSWHPIAGAVEYRIYYQDTPYFTPAGIPQVTVFPPVTSYTDAGAVNLGKRFYRVVVGN